MLGDARERVGIHCLERGEPMNKRIEPVHLCVNLRVNGKVVSATPTPRGAGIRQLLSHPGSRMFGGFDCEVGVPAIVN